MHHGGAVMLCVTALLLASSAAASQQEGSRGAAATDQEAQCHAAPHGTIVGKGIWKTATAPSPHAASAAACCAYCSANSKVGVAGQKACAAYTFEPAHKPAACYLKDNMETSHGGLHGAVSGSLKKLPPPAPPWVPPGPVVPIPRACVPPHDKYDFCNAKLPLDSRVDDLIERLTLEE